MLRLLSQSADCQVLNLNLEGLSDYVWTDASGRLMELEREKAGTILNNMLAIEDEIRRHFRDGCQMILVVEQFIKPTPDGCVIYEVHEHHIRPVWRGRKNYEAYIAWLWQIQENGVEYINTGSLEESAIAISSIYHNSQNPEHHTFRRHFKPLTSWNPNPVITSLMGIEGAGLGEKRATELVDTFGSSLYAVITAPENRLRQVLKDAATNKFLQAVGRK
jgi:hypothetical protein